MLTTISILKFFPFEHTNTHAGKPERRRWLHQGAGYEDNFCSQCTMKFPFWVTNIGKKTGRAHKLKNSRRFIKQRKKRDRTEQPFAILTLSHLNFSYKIFTRSFARSFAHSLVLLAGIFFLFWLSLFQIIIVGVRFFFFSFYIAICNKWVVVSFHCIMRYLVKFIWQLPSNKVTWAF